MIAESHAVVRHKAQRSMYPSAHVPSGDTLQKDDTVSQPGLYSKTGRSLEAALTPAGRDADPVCCLPWEERPQTGAWRPRRCVEGSLGEVTGAGTDSGCPPLRPQTCTRADWAPGLQHCRPPGPWGFGCCVPKPFSRICSGSAFERPGTGPASSGLIPSPSLATGMTTLAA